MAYQPQDDPPPRFDTSAVLVAAAGLAAIAVLCLAGAPWFLGAVLAVGLIGGLILATVVIRRRPAAPASPEGARSVAPDAPRARPFAEVLDALPDPILVVTGADPENLASRRFLYANAAARELFLIQRSEGPLATAVRSPEVLEAADEALFGAVTGEADYERGGAQDRVWRARAFPLPAGEGGLRLAVLTFRDETEVRRAERTRADFLANASHELRTPLASLAGFIETLRGHARDDPGARDRFLAIMHHQAQRMSRLIDDLMSLSRIELNEHVPPSGHLDLALAAADGVDALAPQAAAACVTFRVVAPPAGAAEIIGDRDQVLQVIQNLAENALKYSPCGSEVTVEVTPGLIAAAASAPRTDRMAHLALVTPDHDLGRTYVALRVQDAGPGLSRENLPRLTERFYRVEGQKSGERSGTGLGLAIVKHIVNRHRGGLTVESAEGQGAAFTVYFPSR